MRARTRVLAELAVDDASGLRARVWAIFQTGFGLAYYVEAAVEDAWGLRARVWVIFQTGSGYWSPIFA